MEYGDIAPLIKDAISYLKGIEKFVDPNACCVSTVSGGTGNVPAGFKSVTINGTDVITFPDGSTFTLISGVPFTLTAPSGQSLPALTLSDSGTWYAIK